MAEKTITNMTEATSRDYWISPNALYIELNANDNPDYIQAACISGAQILVYVKGIIGYDAGHNYQRWTLQASPTVFNTHTEKYVYAAIPRTTNANKTAIVVFPSEHIDIYGKNSATEQIGDENYYYIFLQGIISSSGDNGTENRDWLKDHSIATGYLSSDEAVKAGPNESEWFQYSTVDGIVTFLKDLTQKAGTKFRVFFAKFVTIVSGGSITFEGKKGAITGISNEDTELDSEEDVVTPKYMDDNSLSKRHDDKTQYNLEMKDIVARGRADIFGNTVLHSDLTIGIYNKGIEGAHIDFYGNAEFESIVGRSFLEVPELRYNRTTITVGNKWQTQGAGIIEKVWTGDTLSAEGFDTLGGIAKLKLENGEIGAIAVDDKCQGVFHFTAKKNDVSTTDTKDGNFHFAGFTTIYFVVKEIYTTDTLPSSVKAQLGADEPIGDRQFFRYELRAKTCAALPAEDRNRWTDTSHPQPTMHFAAYANETDSDRQSSRLTTTTYQLHLTGMTDWTYTQDNIQLIIGWLNGFSFLQQVWDKEQKKFIQTTKELTGEGIATGNIYMWGTIDQFDRVPSLVSQQLYFQSTSAIDTKPDGIKIADTHLSYELGGWQRDPITPSSSNRVVWQQWLYAYSDGTYNTSEVAFHAADPTALTLVLDKNIISVAISDWYDTSNPDDISFDVTGRVYSGDSPVTIDQGTAIYGYGKSGSQVQMGVLFDVAEDGESITFHITLKGFVGVDVDGVAAEDAFVTFSVETDYGEASAVVTLAQNREGEDGQDGAQGEKGDKGDKGEKGDQGTQGERGYTGVSIRRGEWELGKEYRNDSADGSVASDGNRYLDEVSVTNLVAGTADWYLALPQHNGQTASADNKPSGNGNQYWQKINDLRPLKTSFADITNAFIQFLQARQIVITDENDKAYGAFGGGKDNQYPLWFGGETAYKAVAKFNRKGDTWLGNYFSVVGDKVNVEGTLRARLMYSYVRSLVSGEHHYYISPDTEPYHSFFVSRAAYDVGNLNMIYLPDATKYDGLEIEFFRENLLYNTTSFACLLATNGQKISYPENVFELTSGGKTYQVPFVNTKRSEATSVYYFPNDLVVLKAMNGGWYVIQGNVYTVN